MSRSSVDLPQPLLPTMLTNSPGLTVSVMSCSTGSGSPRTSYCLLRCWICRVPACAMVRVLFEVRKESELRDRAAAPGECPGLDAAGDPVEREADQADH